MPKFNPSAAKLVAVEAYFHNHRPITAHSIKDLEKALPTATGISGMQVKDYLTALVDDNKIRVEKIGSGNWYWCFMGDEKKKKEGELRGWEKEVKGMEGRVGDLKGEVEGEKEAKEEEGGDRVEMLEEIQRLESEKADLEKELGLYQDNDPAQLDYLKELIKLMKEAANMHTDNIYALEGYLKNGMGVLPADINGLKEQFGIPEDMDDVV